MTRQARSAHSRGEGAVAANGGETVEKKTEAACERGGGGVVIIGSV